MINTEDVRLLASLGFTSLMRNKDTHAQAIFEGVLAARPEQEAGAIGLAILHLKKGEYDSAIDLLKKFASSETALTFLGLAYFRKGDQERALKILGDAVTLSPGEATLARDIITAIQTEKKDASFLL